MNKELSKEMRFEGGQSTHEQGERVKIPLLPYKVGKRSGTMVMTVTLELLEIIRWVGGWMGGSENKVLWIAYSIKICQQIFKFLEIIFIVSLIC